MDWGGRGAVSHDPVARVPTMADGILRLLALGVEVKTVLDVGVLHGTLPLITTFADTPHHLFEPVHLHHPNIRKNYRNIPHTIHPMALSDDDGTAYLSCSAIREDGNVTHAQVTDQPTSAEGVRGFVSCEPIPKRRLDSVMSQQQASAPYLLKIDIDGHELAVLEGAVKTLADCAIVVIEAPLNRIGNRVATPMFFERSYWLMQHGFHLVDMTDFAYYDGVLWQVDLIFVRDREVQEICELRPFQSDGFEFDASKWYPISDRLFRD